MHEHVAERFLDKISPEPNSGCWRWDAAQTTMGYGVMTINCKQHYAHRLSYEHFKSPIPEGLQIDHLCRMPWCVNPDHLEVVTSRENTRRGRLREVTIKRHAAKIFCKRGHPLFGENIFIDGNGARVCKSCQKIRHEKRKQAKELLKRSA